MSHTITLFSIETIANARIEKHLNFSSDMEFILFFERITIVLFFCLANRIRILSLYLIRFILILSYLFENLIVVLSVTCYC